MTSTSGLSEALQKKAKEELKEKPEYRQKDIQALRDLVKSDLGLFCPHDDDAFLLMFLRARKFDHESAAKLIRRYYEVRVENEDFYKRFRPFACKHLYEKGLYVKLPKSKETDPQPIFIRPGLWDTETTTLDEVMVGNLLQIEKLIRVEENQVTGVVMILNLGELTWAHAKTMNPFVAKRILGIVQHAMPCRMKGIHYVNVPHFFEYVFGLVKQFMTEKTRSRIHIHASPDYLKEHFDLDKLPESLGGTLDIEPYISKWTKEMMDSENDFKSWEVYGIKKVETVSSNSNADAAGGITGTFKKLNVD